jgi:hypothetical protein
MEILIPLGWGFGLRRDPRPPAKPIHQFCDLFTKSVIALLEGGTCLWGMPILQCRSSFNLSEIDPTQSLPKSLNAVLT